MDETFDGRDAHLDAEAERLATSIADAAAVAPGGANFADLNALRLRYAAVKWLRVVAWFERHAERDDREPITFHGDTSRDDEYQALLTAIAESTGRAFAIAHAASRSLATTASPPANPLWRRLLGRLFASNRSPRRRAGPRVLLCGNLRILAPVCEELLRQGAEPVWLYDRFAVGALRRRMHGVRQLVCNSSEATSHDFPSRLLQRPVRRGDVDLSASVEAWYRRAVAQFGPAQARLHHAVAQHVERLRPDYVVVDEDATPLPRAILACARRRGARTIAVQHGVCGIRFGFVPQQADVCCVWDRASARQLTVWGISADRIRVTGSPYVEAMLQEVAALRTRRPAHDRTSRPLRIAVVGAPPPRDDRPDAVEFRWTSQAYAELTDAAFGALAARADVEVWVRPHPRAASDPHWARGVARLPSASVRDVSHLSQAECLAGVDGVLSFPSSLGVEAARAGLPVVLLMPARAGAILPAAWYGLRGPASTEREITAAIDDLVARRGRSSSAFAGTDLSMPRDSARRIVDVVFDREPTDAARFDVDDATAAKSTEALHGR